MSDPNPEKMKNATVTPEQIGHFLEQTGFVFEMRMNEVFFKAGYDTEINEEFLDLEGDTLREIDIIASKVVNGINVHFVIECKQSATDKWIFICHKRMPRYYFAVKHLPSIAPDVLREKKLFSGFHTFDRSMPLGHNYLCYTIVGNKKAEQHQINECVHKLPKALVDLASRAEGGKHIFFPVALFAGQIFAVFYKGKLVVEERPFLQYSVTFTSEIYRRPVQPDPETNSFRERFSAVTELERWSKNNQKERIRKATRELSNSYQLDFVTEGGLPDYLTLIEKQVGEVQANEWPMPEKPEAVP